MSRLQTPKSVNKITNEMPSMFTTLNFIFVLYVQIKRCRIHRFSDLLSRKLFFLCVHSGLGDSHFNQANIEILVCLQVKFTARILRWISMYTSIFFLENNEGNLILSLLGKFFFYFQRNFARRNILSL